MKLLLLTLLAAALCAEMAQSLQCYTCTSASSNDNCMTAVNCTAPGSRCQTDVWAYVVSKTINKQCATTCVKNNVMVARAGHYTDCCSTDLCNASGATSVKISYGALVVTAGFLGLLLRGGL